MTTRSLRLTAAALGLALLTAACGDDVDATPASAASGVAEVGTADTGLGSVLVDGDGYTLYLFAQDTDGTSTCADDCAATWPPVITDGDPNAGDGADASLLGTVARDDGSSQVTYDGHPLYRYSGDTAPGDTNGQEVATSGTRSPRKAPPPKGAPRTVATPAAVTARER